jgi:hypothetical protein
MPTLAELVAGAKELADQVEDPQNDEALWVRWVNQGVKELHRIVRTAFEDTFFETVDFTLTGSTYQYALPADFLSIRGLDWMPDTTNRASVRRFNFNERNTVGGGPFAPSLYPGQGAAGRMYRVVSRATLMIEPQEVAAGPYRLYYVPKPTVLVDDDDELDDSLEPWSEYVEIVTALKAVAKEKLPTDDLLERRNVMRADIESSVNNDQAEPNTIADTEAGGPWPYR